jgi:hypothetical protein
MSVVVRAARRARRAVMPLAGSSPTTKLCWASANSLNDRQQLVRSLQAPIFVAGFLSAASRGPERVADAV